ncbi:hypothetical protein [Glutamicibacter sp. V16R2B1]|uniref:hypothetical protein n=1 Tax=Glutamicibacter sp. V16R2B1 TaxID=2036207 RepID=UPI0010FEDF0E|nr:hypothetical protein [Glutamicibacter sp. V16R2B1]MCK9901294.1 hypothetical protein [Frankia sp. Cpl3]TLK47983.1 hypothetical protein FDN03_15465 [Glutamicibacter sp. V16R2B1]
MTDHVGQFRVPRQILTRRAARAINAGAARGQPSGPWAQGTVVSVDGGSPPTLTIRMDGETPIPGIRYLASYTPAAGHLVEIALRGPGDLYVIGTLA